jgi:hypothetical protein
MIEVDQHEVKSESIQSMNQDWFHSAGEGSQQVPGEFGIKPGKKQSSTLMMILAVAILAVAAIVLLSPKQSKTALPNDTDDLGAGIVNASGLRGHLVSRWQNGKTQYQLKIEPIDPRENSGFAVAAANPPGPVSINIRILDSAGFALCGKEVLLRSNGGNAQAEQNRERGKDVFQNIVGEDGKVEALWAQGELPCSPDQYRRFDYWDMSTNFPTLAEQDHLQGGHRSVEARDDEGTQSDHEAAAAPKRKAPKKAQSAFLIQGDDRVTAFEPGRNLLTIGPGKNFFILRTSDQAAAASWADDSSLIHYTCDQHATCVLRHAGSPNVVPARMNE